MRKSLLSFLLIFCLMIPCAVVFTACDKNDPPKKEEPPTIVYVTEETTLASAIEQVAEGGQVVLNVDVTLETQINVSKKMTLNMNGKRINNTTDIWNEYQKDENGDYVLDGDNQKIKLPTNEQVWSLISVRENGELIVTGNGRMEAKLNDCYVFDVRGGKLTIENGQFMGNVSVVYVYTGEAVIDTGVYAIQQVASGIPEYSLLINCYNENYENDTATITINGVLFVEYDPSAYPSEGNFLAEGLIVTSQDMQGRTAYIVTADTNA